jgi:hypothetical protein
VLGFGQFGQVDDEVGGDVSEARVDVAGVECLEPCAHQFGVRSGRGDLRSHDVVSFIRSMARRIAAAWAGAKSA